MSYKYYIIDSFTNVAFGGVPVAVFPDADTIPEAYLKALSEEVVACDTVFIKSDDRNTHRYSFLSYDESGACVSGAHTLIAGLTALIEHSSAARDALPLIKIETPEDCIEAFVDRDNKQFPYVLKRQINPNIDHFVPSEEDISRIVNLCRSDISNSKYNCSIASCDSTYLVVPLKSYHAVREASFNTAAWSASSLPASLVDKILLFAPNTDKSGADFHMRLLERNSPAKSDPAVGEALPAFASYLCDQSHVQKGTHSLTVKRGENEGRQSIIHLELDNTGEFPTNIRIGGSGVMTSIGEIVAI